MVGGFPNLGPARRHACWLLTFAAFFHAGCGERREQAGSAAEPASSPAGVARGFATSPPETALTPPEPTPPEPTARYASLAAARDAIEAMLGRAVAPAGAAAPIQRGTVEFEYIWAKSTTRGLAVNVAVSDTICPQEKLLEALRAAGWVDDWTYSADGADGTRMGMFCRQFLCVVEGRWHGFDPTDSTYVPPAGCEITVTCVPRRPDDVPRR